MEERFFSFNRLSLLILFNCSWITFYSAFSCGMATYLHWWLVLITGWVVWYGWHTIWFGNFASILQWLRLQNSYALLIFGQVSPGISFFATMMLLPLIQGIYSGTPVTHNWLFLFFSFCLISTGVALIVESFRTIGIGGAAFENDYSGSCSKLVTSSVYGYIRHPLFTGALLGSAGLACVYSTPLAFGFPIISALFAPLYKYVEESRLLDIYGREYREYQKRVGAFWPRQVSVIFFKKQ